MKTSTKLATATPHTGAEPNRHRKLYRRFKWLSIAAVLFLASFSAEAQIVYTFTDNGAGGTTVTGSGTAMIPDRGFSDTSVGWVSDPFNDSHYLNYGAPHPLSPTPVFTLFPEAGSTLSLSVPGAGDYPHTRLIVDPDSFRFYNQRLAPSPVNSPAGTATLSGSSEFPTFSRANWPIPSGTIDVFGDNTILFVFVPPIVYTFTDNGAGGTTVTGSGTRTIPDRGGTDTSVGWFTTPFTDSHYLNYGAPHPLSPTAVGTLFPEAGSTLNLSVAGSGDYPHTRLIVDPDSFRFYNQRLEPSPINSPAGTATLSGSSEFPTFSRANWPIPSGTIDVFGDNTILFVFVAPIVYTFTDNGAGGTTVTGSGTAMIPDRGGSDTSVGWFATPFADSHYLNFGVPHPLSPTAVGTLFPNSGSTLSLSVAGSGDYPHTRLIVDPDSFRFYNQRLEPSPINSPAGTATLSGSSEYPTFSHANWPFPSGTIDVFEDGTILFVFVEPPPPPAMTYRPDLLIGRRAKNLQRDDFYTLTGRRQTIDLRMQGRRGSRTRFQLELQNDGDIRDRIRLLSQMSPGNRGPGTRGSAFDHTVFADGKNVTASIHRRGLALGPGEKQRLTYKLIVNRDIRGLPENRVLTLTAKSANQRNRIDVGKAKLHLR